MKNNVPNYKDPLRQIALSSLNNIGYIKNLPNDEKNGIIASLE